MNKNPHQVNFESKEGSFSFDFDSYKLNSIFTSALTESFIAIRGHNSIETKRQIIRCLRKFSVFLHEVDIANICPLPEDILVHFHHWLSKQPLKAASKTSVWNVVFSTLNWISRNKPSCINIKTSLHSYKFEELAYTPITSRKNAIDVNTIKSVLDLCYQEIEDIQKRLQHGRDLLEGKTDNKRLSATLIDFLSAGQGITPLQKDMALYGKALLSRVNEAGGSRKLTSLIFLTHQDVFYYYLAVLIQTGGNPYSILQINRDCIYQHSIKPFRASVVWEKKRAHREQKADFDTRRPHNAIQLINQLKESNSALLSIANPRLKNKLFLGYASRKVNIPCQQSLHNMLNAFILKNKLPSFDFKQLRRAGAILHERAGNIVAAQLRLNHIDSRTTLHYINDQVWQEENDRLILKFMGLLIDPNSAENTKHSVSTHQEVNIQNSAESVFGFRCLDPFSGVAPNSKKGSLCLSFTHCATCPRALIKLDDPKIVAKLLVTQTALEKARKKSIEAGWLRRFESIYGPTLFILTNELIPKISEVILNQAQSHLTSFKIFDLE